MTNRAFLYGDGFFESIYCGKGKQMPLWDYHRNRAKESAALLGMSWPSELDEQILLDEVLNVCMDQDCRIRLTFYRNSGGLYAPESNNILYHIQSELIYPSPISSGIAPLIRAQRETTISELLQNLQPGKAGISQFKKYADAQGLCNIKSVSAQLYVQVGMEKKSAKMDEMILLNQYDSLCECLSGNLWIERKGILYGPHADQGPIEGVMKRYLTIKFPNIFQTRRELSYEDLLTADAVYCSNAVRGLSKLRILT